MEKLLIRLYQHIQIESTKRSLQRSAKKILNGKATCCKRKGGTSIVRSLGEPNCTYCASTISLKKDLDKNKNIL